MAHLTNFSLEFFIKFSQKMPLNLFYTIVQKSQKWPKTQIKGGPALSQLRKKLQLPASVIALCRYFRVYYLQNNVLLCRKKMCEEDVSRCRRSRIYRERNSCCDACLKRKSFSNFFFRVKSKNCFVFILLTVPCQLHESKLANRISLYAHRPCIKRLSSAPSLP